ncbi:UDP-galactopyranose mutase [Patescibacteria group bacterium]|nr:UDP-galactopyranose mutase [Patescibacteria group bacterium]
MKNQSNQILIIGSGISGSTLAERYASIGKKVLVLEKRNHVGGNCYDLINKDGLLVSKYGAHIFHTNNKDVWEYLQKFSSWKPYSHKVKAFIGGKLVPVPVNIETVNILYKLDIKNKPEMQDWLYKNQVKITNPKNSEEVALSRVGKDLYEKMFKNYTIKQWGKHPKELDSSIISRIPVRIDFEDRYSSDNYQAQPVGGYTKIFKNMLSSKNIEIRLNTDFFEFKKENNSDDFEKVFYTGAADHFFDFCFSKKGLGYRSLKFEFETHNKEFFQDHAVVNFPNDHEYTRIVEYKHITGQKHSKTTISKEYPNSGNEPYYPMLTEDNMLLYSKYKKLIIKLSNVHFIGRLAEFKYINMDEAFGNALELFYSLEKD